jgi:HlyD family secretion protein
LNYNAKKIKTKVIFFKPITVHTYYKMKKGTLIKLIIGLLVLIGTAIGLKKAGIIGGNNFTKVAIDSARVRNIVETVNASGKIYPVSEVKVSPDISGEILELNVEEGDSVQKGQLLARIDASLYTNNVTRANAQVNQSKSGVANAKAQLAQLNVALEQARTNYNRNLKLYNERVISAAEFDQAKAAFNTAQANNKVAMEGINGNSYAVETAVAGLSEANQNIRRANIYAPMSGVVTKLNVKKGERVVGTAQMAGTEIMTIANISLMKLDVEVGENDIQKINISDTANIEVDAYSKRKFKGLVTKITQSNTGGLAAAATSLSGQATNYIVSIEIQGSSYQDLIGRGQKFPFRPGMSASAEILTKHHNNIVCVPINAVTTRDLDSTKEETEIISTDDAFKEYVFVVNKDNKVQLKEVKTDIQDNEYIEILSGLNVNDRIVVAPYSAIATKLKDKTEVEIVKKKELFDKEQEE